MLVAVLNMDLVEYAARMGEHVVEGDRALFRCVQFVPGLLGERWNRGFA